MTYLPTLHRCSPPSVPYFVLVLLPVIVPMLRFPRNRSARSLDRYKLTSIFPSGPRTHQVPPRGPIYDRRGHVCKTLRLRPRSSLPPPMRIVCWNIVSEHTTDPRVKRNNPNQVLEWHKNPPSVSPVSALHPVTGSH